MHADPTPVYVISPSSAVTNTEGLPVAARHLEQLGFDVTFDRAARSRYQRFAGTDSARADAFMRAARSKAPIVMTTRGGYGMTRLIDRLDFAALADAQKHWVGLSDFTAFHLAMLAKVGAGTWAGPALLEDFSGDTVDETTAGAFCDAMHGRLHGLGFQCEGPSGVDERGVLWGGNLSLVCTLMGSEYFPDIRGGLLFLEEVGEHPYRVERLLTQLLLSGVIDQQNAVIFGYVNRYKTVPNDQGYDWSTVVRWLRSKTRTPVICGLPFGHEHPKLTLPHGAILGLCTDGNEAFLEFPTHSH
ncbi:MAG: LD-carboxypeptidase [Burkholderiaceae bacterium]